MALWADDIVQHVTGKRPLAGDFSGKSASLDRYGKVFSELGGATEVVEVRDVLVSEEHGVALVKERMVRAERSLTFHRVVVYRISGGKIAKTWSHDYYLYTLDEFWS